MPGPLYPIQPTFARGEISPRLFSRADIDHWKMALAECVNYMILKQGGLRRRSGTEWINEVKDSAAGKVRLHPFIFSVQQAYVLEFGDLYVRFYANGGIVNKGSHTGVEITSGSPAVVSWTAHGLTDGDPVIFSTTGQLPMGVLVGITYYVISSTADDFQIALTRGGSPINTSGSQNGVHSIVSPVEVITPYSIDDIWSLQFSQSADVLYIAHKDFAPRTMTRTSASAFSLSFYTYLDGPYLGENGTATTMTPSGTSGSVTITASSVTGVNDSLGFQPSDVGRPITLQYSSKWYWAQITAVTDTENIVVDVEGLVEADGTVVTAFPGTSATGGWKLGAWSALTGWPACVSFYQERLVWGRTDTQPQTVWMTKAGVLDNYSTTEPLQDDDAITITILAGEVNSIQWLAEGQDLLIGTTGAMRTLGAADAGKNFSASNLVQKRQSTFGSLDIQPVRVGEVAIYASYYGVALREFLFSFQQNSYIAPELTILSEHMLRSGVTQMAYAQERDSIIWTAMGNGELVGITYERDQQIVAMTRHRLGGSFGDTEYGVVESVATMPGADRSELWVAVKRTINGATRRYIERLEKPFEATVQEQDEAFFVDSGFTYSGEATGTITGVHWLKGETLAVLADGALVPDVTVASDGSFTLANGKEASKITFGLRYKSRGKTLPIATGTGDGTGLGRRKNVIGANIDYMETGYLEVGSPSARELSLAVGRRSATDEMDAPPALKDGFEMVRFDRGWKDAGQIVFETDQPLPCTIRSITPVFDGEP